MRPADADHAPVPAPLEEPISPGPDAACVGVELDAAGERSRVGTGLRTDAGLHGVSDADLLVDPGADLSSALIAPEPPASATPLITDSSGTHADKQAVDAGHVGVSPAEFERLARELERERARRLRAESMRDVLLTKLSKADDELRQGADIQQQFLPASLPSLPGLEIAAMFRPACHVSGDYYDVRLVENRWLEVLVADAVGHGVPAALLTIVIAECLRELRRDRAGGAEGRAPGVQDPGVVLAAVNEAVCACQGDSPRFVTAVAALIDLETGETRLSSAGHPAPLLLPGPGPARTCDDDPTCTGFEEVAAEGPLLGVFPEAAFEPLTFTLDLDRPLVLHTDGFEVAYPGRHNADGRPVPGGDHLARLARGLRGAGDPGGLADAVCTLATEIDAQPGSFHQADDLTAVVIARRDPALGEHMPLLAA